MAIHDIGDKVQVRATFTLDGVTVTPTTVTCTVRAPSGDEQTLTVSGPSGGTYLAELEPDEEGTWWYRFAGSGGYIAAEEGVFSIRHRRVAT